MFRNFRHIALLLLLAFFLPAMSMAQYKDMKQGEKFYDEKDYTSAAQKFNIASANEKNAYADYNAGNALSKNGNYTEAIRRYTNVVETSDDNAIRAQAFYNMGNNYLALENYKDGMEAYKNALRINPADDDARHNYLYAQKLLQMQQQQQEGENQEEQQSENSEEDRQSGDNHEEMSGEPEANNDNNEPDPGEENNFDENLNQSQNDAAMQPNTEEMSKLEAERLLEMIQKQDEKIQKQLIQKKGGKNPSTKQW